MAKKVAKKDSMKRQTAQKNNAGPSARRFYVVGLGFSVVVLFLSWVSLTLREQRQLSLLASKDSGEQDFLTQNPGVQNQVRVGAYIPDYRLEHLMNPEQNEFLLQNVDDVFLFSLSFRADGSVYDPSSAFFSMDKFNYTLGQFGMSQLQTTVFLTFGGGGRSKDFYSVLDDENNGKRFISNLVQLRKNHMGLSGFDFDPEVALEEKHFLKFASFLKNLKFAFEAENLDVKLSMALHYWQNPGKNVCDQLDRINVMAYDLAQGQHSSFRSTEQIIAAFLNHGVSKEKLYIGIPAYGRHEKKADVRTFSEIVNCDGSINLDAVRSDSTDGFHYNGHDMIRKKIRLVTERELGGVFFWEAGQDCLKDGISLLQQARRSVSGY